MPTTKAVKRVRTAARRGESPGSQAGEFVHEEIKHVRQGKHGARSAKQAIAIGLSKARRAGVKLPPPKPGKASPETRAQAKRDYRKGQSAPAHRPSRTRSRAVLGTLRREGRAAASHQALSRQASASARKRGAASLHSAAVKAVHTKGKAGRSRAARKAAKTRAMDRKAA